MPSELETGKRHLARSRLLCTHIQGHLTELYQQYHLSHPKFAEHVVSAAEYCKFLDLFLGEVQAKLLQL